jgi:hypothetical protein
MWVLVMVLVSVLQLLVEVECEVEVNSDRWQKIRKDPNEKQEETQPMTGYPAPFVPARTLFRGTRFVGWSGLPTVGDDASPACFLFSDVFDSAGVFVVPPDEIAGDDADAAGWPCPCCCPDPDPLACGCPPPCCCDGSCCCCGIVLSCFSGEFAELEAVPGEFMLEDAPGVGLVTEGGALE